MSYDKDVRKRRRIYKFASHEISYEGMTLWEFCQAVMQLPADARIYNVSSDWGSDSILLSVGSKEFDLVEDGVISSYWIYNRNQRTFVEQK